MTATTLSLFSLICVSVCGCIFIFSLFIIGLLILESEHSEKILRIFIILLSLYFTYTCVSSVNRKLNQLERQNEIDQKEAAIFQKEYLNDSSLTRKNLDQIGGTWKRPSDYKRHNNLNKK